MLDINVQFVASNDLYMMMKSYDKTSLSVVDLLDGGCFFSLIMDEFNLHMLVTHSSGGILLVVK